MENCVVGWKIEIDPVTNEVVVYGEGWRDGRYYWAPYLHLSKDSFRDLWREVTLFYLEKI